MFYKEALKSDGLKTGLIYGTTAFNKQGQMMMRADRIYLPHHANNPSRVSDEGQKTSLKMDSVMESEGYQLIGKVFADPLKLENCIGSG